MIEEIIVNKPTLTVANIKSMYDEGEMLKPVGANIKPAKVKSKIIPLKKTIKAVMECITQSPGATDKQIAKITELSGGCVGRVCRYLNENKVTKRVQTNRAGTYGEHANFLIDAETDHLCHNKIYENDVLGYLKKNGLTSKPAILFNIKMSDYRLKKALASLVEQELITQNFHGKSGLFNIWAYQVKA